MCRSDGKKDDYWYDRRACVSVLYYAQRFYDEHAACERHGTSSCSKVPPLPTVMRSGGTGARDLLAPYVDPVTLPTRSHARSFHPGLLAQHGARHPRRGVFRWRTPTLSTASQAATANAYHYV